MNTNKRICLVFMSLLFTVILVCYLPENKPEFQVGIFSSISNGYVEGKMSSNPDELPLTKTLSKVRELGKSCSHGEKDAHKMSSSPATLRLNINKLNKIKVWKFAREDTKKTNEIGTHSKTFLTTNTFSNVRPFRDQTTKSEVFESSFEESKKAQFKESKKSSPSIKPSNANELKTSNIEMTTSDERTANIDTTKSSWRGFRRVSNVNDFRILNTPRKVLENSDRKPTTTNNFSSSSSSQKTLPNLNNLENKISTLRLDVENSDLNRTFCRTNSKFRNGLMCPKLYTELGGRCFYNETKPVCTDIRRKARYSLRKSQLAITRMLGILDLIARRHNLTYWLTSGTLLGAVRHQGFIPWDSDADIGMSLQDYEKFFRTASRDLPSDIFFQNTESDPNLRPEQSYLYEGFKYKDIGMYIRIWNPRLRDTKSCNKVCIMYKCKFHDGLMIDMFIQEKIPNKTFPLKYVLFEGLVFPVQNNWKEALTGLYGSDYMLLPKQGNKNRVQLDYPEPLMSCDEFRELLAKSVRRRKLRKKKIGRKLKP